MLSPADLGMFWEDGFVPETLRNIYVMWFGQIPHEHIDPPLGEKIEKTLLMDFIDQSLFWFFSCVDLWGFSSKHPWYPLCKVWDFSELVRIFLWENYVEIWKKQPKPVWETGLSHFFNLLRLSSFLVEILSLVLSTSPPSFKSFRNRWIGFWVFLLRGLKYGNQLELILETGQGQFFSLLHWSWFLVEMFVTMF